MVTNLTRASGQPEAQIAKLAYGCGFMVLGEREVEWNLIIIILKKKHKSNHGQNLLRVVVKFSFLLAFIVMIWTLI